ncbi:hypothetical protein MLD38_027158 [Melastoma candidum]|uniref:Uncharacterized protein n=1 Tax=Melastoma candidum TaxID=119954 RepID=A0ACB9P5L0_9MYRT|nr:hypothetical protein MLD38_027158 [Melastoma candidum]
MEEAPGSVRSVLMIVALSVHLGLCRGDPRITEVRLLCTEPRVNGSIVPDFAEVMREISVNVTSRGWGKSYLNSTVPPLYGLAQCHGDLNATDCLLCYAASRTRVPRCLPRPGRLYLDGCFIRYDEYEFYNETVDPVNDMVNCADANVTDQGGGGSMFANRVEMVLRNVTGKALAVRDRVGEEDMFGVDGIEGAYALAQCWSTLSLEQCKTCLRNASSLVKSCLPRAEGRAMNAGCFVRYSNQKFYSIPNGRGSLKLGTAIAVSLAAIAVASLLVVAAFLGYRTYSRAKQLRKGLLRLPTTVTKSNLYFKYETLEKATNFFDEKRKLGQGGAGSVYKGTLMNGKVVAVKRLVFNTRQWVDDFFNEVDLISGIQHKNLVSLLGCSIEGPESLLVYEYVPNGSLDQALFGEAKRKLTWEERIGIITGTAEGIAYLHGDCGIRIIHRDIKASNILLDKDLMAKVADFGLARCVAQDKSHLTTGIAGTLGYMAPEYLVRGQLTEKADVYAFGVLVLEIMSGRNSSVVAHGSFSLLQSVWMHHQSDDLISCVDPALWGEFPAVEAANVLRIGLLCAQASPKLRPSMSQVVRMLQDNGGEHPVPSPGQPPFLSPGCTQSFYETGMSSNTSNHTWGSQLQASGASSNGSL